MPEEAKGGGIGGVVSGVLGATPFGAIGSIASSVIGGMFEKAAARERARVAERQGLLDNENQYEKFLAQRMTEDPQAAIKNLLQSRVMAGKMNIDQASGINIGEHVRGTGITTGEERQANDPGLKAIIQTLLNPEKNNLSLNAQTGLFDENRVNLNQTVSKDIADEGDKYTGFQRGGVKGTFGGAPAGGPSPANVRQVLSQPLRKKKPEDK